MIRVAQVMGQMNGGGVEAVVMNYYRHIDRSLIQFDFVVDSDSKLVPQDEVEFLGGRILTVPPLKNLISHRKALWELFVREKWPIVHSHRNALSVFPLQVAKEAGVPVRIAHSHSTAGKGEYAKNVVKLALKQLSNIYPTHRLACSRYAGEWLFGKHANFEILYNAIELEKFVFSEEARMRVRADLGLVDDALVIGHVGRFMPQKNQMFLMESFEELSRMRGDAVLLLAGDGEQRSLAECWVHERGLSKKVLFLGQRDDVQELYCAMDVFALPSLYEGLCLVGIEAQRSGLPCFLSDTITREVDVTDTVRFLPIEDPHSWAELMAGLRVGDRITVRDDSFDRYDIRKAGDLLGNYYEVLTGNGSDI